MSKPTLREVQKADTRKRLLDAASQVFDREGYGPATVDQITTEAGASRPTFYSHFRDKEQVLAELMERYVERAVPYMEKLPGPAPTIEELMDWLAEVGVFLKQERALFSLLNQVVGYRPPDSRNFGQEVCLAWVQGLSRQAPAFAAVLDKNFKDNTVKARAELLIVQIVWAGANFMVDKQDALARAKVELVATTLHEFLHDPRCVKGYTAKQVSQSGT